jgi:ABC-type sugar transport system permease subunit
VWREIVRNRAAYFLLFPAFALLLVFTYAPAGLALVMSFLDWRPGVDSQFVGLRNFARILADPLFWTAWRNTIAVAAFSLTIPFIIPFIVAEAIFNLRSKTAQNAYRVLIVVPIIVPTTVILLVWKYIYAYPAGGLNSVLRAIGLNDWARPFLGDSDTALIAILMIGFPFMIGIAPLIYLAGLMNISSEVLDSSQIDGASTLRRIISIDIPHVLGQFRLMLILTIIAVLQAFGSQLVLTMGGPAGSTMVPGLYLYAQAFGIDRFSKINTSLGQAAAMGLILFVVIIGLSILANRYRREDHET